MLPEKEREKACVWEEMGEMHTCFTYDERLQTQQRQQKKKVEQLSPTPRRQ